MLKPLNYTNQQKDGIILLHNELVFVFFLPLLFVQYTNIVFLTCMPTFLRSILVSFFLKMTSGDFQTNRFDQYLAKIWCFVRSEIISIDKIIWKFYISLQTIEQAIKQIVIIARGVRIN